MSAPVEVNATSKCGLDYVVSDEQQQPPSEVPGDVFDRQRVMKNFSQHLIEQQRVFVLGVGGIGSSVAMCLVRMGVDTVYLLDRDHVDASNLNRQILFSVADVGRSKVEAAAAHLKQIHNLRTNIFEYHTDAVSNWSRVVEIAKKCTVIFNNIDYGAVFDYAVNSLCKSLGILYVAGSTYANNVDISLFSGLLGDPCWACNNSTMDSFTGTDNREKTLELLLPHCIQTHSSIEFIPKDRSFPTRTVGSWVGVCVSGSCLIVNTWMQHIMKTRNADSETGKPCHHWNQLNLSMFDGGYYTAGFPNEQDPNCPICLNAKKLAEQG